MSWLAAASLLQFLFPWHYMAFPLCLCLSWCRCATPITSHFNLSTSALTLWQRKKRNKNLNKINKVTFISTGIQLQYILKEDIIQLITPPEALNLNRNKNICKLHEQVAQFSVSSTWLIVIPDTELYLKEISHPFGDEWILLSPFHFRKANSSCL